ncbi:MAG TPA: type I restriction-modification enzyme R subunit C-terminal domain-containing protein [Steroidobacteraceae bacterium]|nr:type I restriction-modification enzyme R subunit C-terminal domain-containing protein [Steroidobacteraceae bacterium]
MGKNLDPFDLICHVAFDKKPLTRRERAMVISLRGEDRARKPLGNLNSRRGRYLGTWLAGAPRRGQGF